MALIRRILCPTDFSSSSLKAFQYADQLAQRMEAELVLAYAFDIAERPGISGAEHPVASQPDLQNTGEPHAEIRPADRHVREQLDALRR